MRHHVAGLLREIGLVSKFMRNAGSARDRRPAIKREGSGAEMTPDQHAALYGWTH
jgi:hypothetical protein